MKKIYLLVFIATVLLTTAVGAYFLSSGQTNILLYGIEGTRTDTMLLITLDASEKVVHVVSIPRDTYFQTPGYNKQGQAKLNAVFGFKEIGGPEGLSSAIETITGMEIDYFIQVDYEAVEKIVDLIGGVEVDVPFAMKYSDPYAKPPLVIDLPAGPQVLKGDTVLGYLRFRKSSDGKIREGDIQRIERQQAFLSAASKKVLSWRLPQVTTQALKYVESDLKFAKAVELSLGMAGVSKEKIYFHVLPPDRIGTGKDGLSYYFHNPSLTNDLFNQIREGTFVPPVKETEAN